MTRVLALIGLCLVFLGAPFAEEAHGPRLRVEPTTFDFGKVRPGRSLRKEFRLRNLGDRPLIIDRVSMSCRCTRAEVEESTLDPGGSTPLRVGLETPRSPGPVKESVLVRSNDPDTPLLEILLLATVVPE